MKRKNESGAPSSPSQKARSVKTSAFPVQDNIQFPICIVDNGGWTVKFGILQSNSNSNSAILGGDADATTLITAPAAATAMTSTAATNATTTATSTTRNTAIPIMMSSMYNATARPPHQLTVLSGDEITTHMKNLGQLSWNYAMERGMICDGETQLRVWNRMLENVGVIPMPVVVGSGFLATIAATATRRGKQPQQQPSSHTQHQPRRITHSSQDCTFLLLEPPFVPSVISEGVDCILFRELGLGRVARLLGPCMAAIHYISFCQSITTTTTTTMTTTTLLPNDEEFCSPTFSESSLWSNDNTNCCCVVDSGYSFTHIVPTHHAGEAIINAIRRLDLGGKVLTNLLKEYVTYRQWNMMDEFHIVNDVKEQLCFVSDQFDKEMTNARNIRKGLRWFDREYLLPDFVNTFRGTVRLPEPLQRQRELKEMEQMELDVERMEEEKRRREIVEEAKELQEDKANEEVIKADKNGNRSAMLRETDAGKTTMAGSLKPKKQGKKKNHRSRKEGSSTADEENGDDIIMDDHISDTDSDDETDQLRLQRLKTMRDAERKRREQESLDRQALAMSVERFAIPEVLFRPSDIGLDCGGIAEAIVESITACPPTVRAAMYHNVLLVGGNAKIPGFHARVELELRKLAPTNYEIRVHMPEDPISYAWEVSAVVSLRLQFLSSYPTLIWCY